MDYPPDFSKAARADTIRRHVPLVLVAGDKKHEDRLPIVVVHWIEINAKFEPASRPLPPLFTDWLGLLRSTSSHPRPYNVLDGGIEASLGVRYFQALYGSLALGSCEAYVEYWLIGRINATGEGKLPSTGVELLAMQNEITTVAAARERLSSPSFSSRKLSPPSRIAAR